MAGEELQRIRIKYAKQKSIRFIGHLDMLRAWERTLRRADLPVAFTQGFHPHARINLGAALPLGFTSSWELVEVWLEKGVAIGDLEQMLQAALPPGIAILAIEVIDNLAPKLQKQIVSAEYEVTFKSPSLLNDMRGRIDELLAQENHPRTRRGKTYDLRPLVEKLTLEENRDGITLRMRLTVGEGNTGRPDEVILALEEDPLSVLIHRNRLIFRDSSPGNN